MKVKELKAELEKEGLIPLNYYGCPKYYVPGEAIFDNGKWTNLPDVFGVYISAENEYIFFVTDSERGICCHNEAFSTEEEVCEYIIKRARISKGTFLNDTPYEIKPSHESDRYIYYRFDIGDGVMRKKGNIVEYIDKNGNWVENIELLRMFIGLDTGFYEITEAEADAIVQNRKNKSENREEL